MTVFGSWEGADLSTPIHVSFNLGQALGLLNVLSTFILTDSFDPDESSAFIDAYEELYSAVEPYQIALITTED
jgi:hypothetical protein